MSDYQYRVRDGAVYRERQPSTIDTQETMEVWNRHMLAWEPAEPVDCQDAYWYGMPIAVDDLKRAGFEAV